MNKKNILKNCDSIVNLPIQHINYEKHDNIP